MSQPKVYNPHGDVFAEWLNAQPRSAHYGANGGAGAINSAPRDTAALAEHFIALSLRELRAGWPACVLDALASGVTLGAVARALTVVSRRLYGVSVDERTGRVIGDLDSPGQTPAPPAPRLPKSFTRKDHIASPLTPAVVRCIRAMHKQGSSRDDIAERMGVPKNVITRVCNGNCFQGVK